MEIKRGRGRPKGSLGKKKIINIDNQEPILKRGRGRPKGSKGKSKLQQRTEQAIPLDYKEIKRQIRALGKCKRNTPKKTEERREINEKIRELKKQLTPIIKEVDPEKQKLIDEIMAWNTKYRPYILEAITIEHYKQYTIEILKKHIIYLNEHRPY